MDQKHCACCPGAIHDLSTCQSETLESGYPVTITGGRGKVWSWGENGQADCEDWLQCPFSAEIHPERCSDRSLSRLLREGSACNSSQGTCTRCTVQTRHMCPILQFSMPAPLLQYRTTWLCGNCIWYRCWMELNMLKHDLQTCWNITGSPLVQRPATSGGTPNPVVPSNRLPGQDHGRQRHRARRYRVHLEDFGRGGATKTGQKVTCWSQMVN